MRTLTFILFIVLLLACESTSDTPKVTGSHNLQLKLGNQWEYYDTGLVGKYNDTTREHYYVFRIVRSGEMPWELEDGNITKLISYKSIDTTDKENADSWYYYTEQDKGIIIGKLKDRSDPESDIVPHAFLPNVLRIGERNDFGLSAEWDLNPAGSIWPRITPTDTGNTVTQMSYVNLWHCEISGETDIPYFSLNSLYTFVYLEDSKIIRGNGGGGLIINGFRY